MKCKEIQIFDWIQDKDGNPMQITIVSKTLACATFGNNESRAFVDDFDQPEPIEITDDIMRKNNWEECDYPLPRNHHEYYYVKDEDGNHLVWNSEVLSIWLDWEEGKDDGAYANIAMPIKYVHQLQQVLRLAGLTEMANNFKI